MSVNTSLRHAKRHRFEPQHQTDIFSTLKSLSVRSLVLGEGVWSIETSSSRDTDPGSSSLSFPFHKQKVKGSIPEGDIEVFSTKF